MGLREVRTADPRKEWDSAYSIRFLPDLIRDLFREYADQLHSDLNRNRLEVTLIPAPVPRHSNHMVRVAISQNPQWYQELYRTRPHLKRQRSLVALDRIRQIRDPELSSRPVGVVEQKYGYVTFYREVIFDMLVFGRQDSGLYLPPDSRAQEFFYVSGIEKTLEPPF